MHEIIWRQSALDELARLWIDADSLARESISRAALEIDSLLTETPSNVGESRSDNRRIEFVPPLGFIFEIRSAVRQVFIIHVWSPKHGRI